MLSRSAGTNSPLNRVLRSSRCNLCAGRVTQHSNANGPPFFSELVTADFPAHLHQLPERFAWLPGISSFPASAFVRESRQPSCLSLAAWDRRRLRPGCFADGGGGEPSPLLFYQRSSLRDSGEDGDLSAHYAVAQMFFSPLDFPRPLLSILETGGPIPAPIPVATAPCRGRGILANQPLLHHPVRAKASWGHLPAVLA